MREREREEGYLNTDLKEYYKFNALNNLKATNKRGHVSEKRGCFNGILLKKKSI